MLRPHSLLIELELSGGWFQFNRIWLTRSTWLKLYASLGAVAQTVILASLAVWCGRLQIQDQPRKHDNIYLKKPEEDWDAPWWQSLEFPSEGFWRDSGLEAVPVKCMCWHWSGSLSGRACPCLWQERWMKRKGICKVQSGNTLMGKMEVYFLCVFFARLPLDCSVYPPLKTVYRAAANQSRKKMNILRKAKRQTNKSAL